jgi:hypothetical protein
VVTRDDPATAAGGGVQVGGAAAAAVTMPIGTVASEVAMPPSASQAFSTLDHEVQTSEP